MLNTLFVAMLVLVGEGPAKDVSVPAEYGQAQGVVTDGKTRFLVTQRGVFPEKRQQQEGTFDFQKPLEVIWGEIPKETLKYKDRVEFDIIANPPDDPKGKLFIQVKIPQVTRQGRESEAVAGICQYTSGKLRFIPAFGAPTLGHVDAWSSEQGMIRFPMRNKGRDYLAWKSNTQFLRAISPPDPVYTLTQRIQQVEEKIGKDPKNAESWGKYLKQLEEELDKLRTKQREEALASGKVRPAEPTEENSSAGK